MLHGVVAQLLQRQLALSKLLARAHVEGGVALLTDLLVVRFLQHAIGRNQRPGKQVHTADVGVEQVLHIGRVAADFGVEVDAAALQARAGALATLLASHAPLTLQATKVGLRRIAQEGAPEASEGERPGDDLIVMTYMSEDFREGMEAFLAKRPPNFKGR